jgi:Tol biopolymer transport system component
LVTVLRQVDNTERLYLTDLKTKENSPLSEREARHPCWLDEENIAFLSSDASSKDTEVLVVNTATRETRSLTLFSGEANWLAIHPDGKRIAVAMRSPDGKERLLLRNLRNADDQTIQEGAEYEYLRWSPDGSALCWNKPGVSRNAPHLSGGIWMLEAGQAQPRLIANDGYCPVWSQNGTAIYFTTRSGEQALWRYDLTQKRVHKVCDWGTVYSFDVVGNRVAFSELRNDTQIYSVSIE